MVNGITTIQEIHNQFGEDFAAYVETILGADADQFQASFGKQSAIVMTDQQGFIFEKSGKCMRHTVVERAVFETTIAQLLKKNSIPCSFFV